MSKIILKFIFFTLAFTFSAANIFAQDEDVPNEVNRQAKNPTRAELLRELGLTQEQVQQIRKLNAERKPLMQEAQRRLREANRNLDLAIYADKVDEQVIQTRLKEVQESQAEVQKIRANTELEVRKILTPEQLVKFRDLRETFVNRLQTIQQRRQNRRQNRQNQMENKQNPNLRNQRLNNRQKQ